MKVDPSEFVHFQRRFRGPAWRRGLAEFLAEHEAPAVRAKADKLVLELCNYLRESLNGPDRLARAARAYPHIAAAEALRNGPLSDELKILALADCPAAEIAQRLGIEPAALAAWEALDFDVRPLRGCVSWVANYVIRAEEGRGHGHLAAQLKSAYGGGAIAAVALLDAAHRVKLGLGASLFDESLCLHVKFMEALEAPIRTDRQKLAFNVACMELRARESRLDLRRRRLEVHCQQALWKHQQAEYRLERARQREQVRAARAVEREAARATLQEWRNTVLLAAAEEFVARQRATQVRAVQSSLAQLRWAPLVPPLEQTGPGNGSAVPSVESTIGVGAELNFPMAAGDVLITPEEGPDVAQADTLAVVAQEWSAA
jgi:hypothetical protein